LPTVIGVGLFALLWFTGAIRRIFTGFKMVAPPPRPVAKDTPAEVADDGPTPGDFDPDAALARYMAGRSTSQSTPEQAQAPRGFGRRGLPSQ
jgi:hypothetical protein